jgi:Arylsulfotransferase (ASST)
MIGPMFARRRSRVLAAALAVIALAVSGCQGAAESVSAPYHDYVTLPGRLPPVVDVTAYGGAAGHRSMAADLLVFLAPKDGDLMTGPMIVDGSGEPVWIGPEWRGNDLRVQRYRGRPVLTWWRGLGPGGTGGTGELVIMDRSYQTIATVTVPGMRTDMHETTLTPRGTALLIGARKVRADLSAFGGPSDGWVIDNVVHEIDVDTGRVLFRWSALRHIPLTDSETKIPSVSYGDGTRDEPWDFVHVNAITEDGDGLLVSARNTCAVYRIDRRSGDVDWILGGPSSDFRMLGDARFAWQHDAQRQPDGTITLFDNHSTPKLGGESRGLRLAVREKSRTASVITEYPVPNDRVAQAQGNLEVLSNGHVVIGWGSDSYYSEFTDDGQILLDADFGSGESYRVYRLPWVGTPSDPPALVVQDDTAYVSWNGATEVDSWRFLAGPDARRARVVATVERTGFETSAPVPDRPYIAAQALDTEGHVLATADFGG